MLICAGAAPAHEARVQRFFLLIIGMIVAAVAVGLPDFHHGIRHGLPIAVEDLTFDANTLALRRIRDARMFMGLRVSPMA